MTKVKLTQHVIHAEGFITDAEIMLDMSGRPFQPGELKVSWEPNEGAWMLRFVTVTGKTIRRDGLPGTSDRYCWFEPYPHRHRVQLGRPLADAPAWVWQFIQDHEPNPQAVMVR